MEVARNSYTYFFFDDGVGAGSSRDIAKCNGSVVRSGLALCGFLVNHEKSDWDPKTIFSWIGFIINTRLGFIYATDARIGNLCCDLNELCADLEVFASIHVKRLASVVGKIISLSACCGNVTQIVTRYLHLVVNSRHSWHSIVFIQDEAKKELLVWRDNLRNLNGVPFVPSKIVFSDASSTGCAAYIQGSSLLFHRNWSAAESQKSSTWRELATVKYSLEAFNDNLAGHRVRWNTDNQNVVRIVQFGSMIEELQEFALDIFLFASSHNIRLDLTWIPRDQNSEADHFSKVVDIDDYSVHDGVFIHLDGLLDRFASNYNAKLPRFLTGLICLSRVEERISCLERKRLSLLVLLFALIFCSLNAFFLSGFVLHPWVIARFASRKGFARYAFSGLAGVCSIY